MRKRIVLLVSCVCVLAVFSGVSVTQASAFWKVGDNLRAALANGVPEYPGEQPPENFPPEWEVGQGTIIVTEEGNVWEVVVGDGGGLIWKKTGEREVTYSGGYLWYNGFNEYVDGGASDPGPSEDPWVTAGYDNECQWIADGCPGVGC